MLDWTLRPASSTDAEPLALSASDAEPFVLGRSYTADNNRNVSRKQVSLRVVHDPRLRGPAASAGALLLTVVGSGPVFLEHYASAESGNSYTKSGPDSDDDQGRPAAAGADRQAHRAILRAGESATVLGWCRFSLLHDRYWFIVAPSNDKGPSSIGGGHAGGIARAQSVMFNNAAAPSSSSGLPTLPVDDDQYGEFADDAPTALPPQSAETSLSSSSSAKTRFSVASSSSSSSDAPRSSHATSSSSSSDRGRSSLEAEDSSRRDTTAPSAPPRYARPTSPSRSHPAPHHPSGSGGKHGHHPHHHKHKSHKPHGKKTAGGLVLRSRHRRPRADDGTVRYDPADAEIFGDDSEDFDDHDDDDDSSSSDSSSSGSNSSANVPAALRRARSSNSSYQPSDDDDDDNDDGGDDDSGSTHSGSGRAKHHKKKRKLDDDEDSASSSSASSTVRTVGGKPMCMYGAKCYRKNPQHIRDFWHPAA